MSCSMKWKMATARTTKINRATPSPRHDLEHYCRDLDGWPRSWMGLEKDLPPGEQLLDLFRPFLEYLAAVGSVAEDHPETRGQHVDAGRGVHSRPQRRSATAPATSGTAPLQNDRIRR